MSFKRKNIGRKRQYLNIQTLSNCWQQFICFATHILCITSNLSSSFSKTYNSLFSTSTFLWCLDCPNVYANKNSWLHIQKHLIHHLQKSYVRSPLQKQFHLFSRNKKSLRFLTILTLPSPSTQLCLAVRDE